MINKNFSFLLLSLLLLAGFITVQNTFNITSSSNKQTKQLSTKGIVIDNAPGTIIENQVLTANITLKNSPNSIIRNNVISGFGSFYGIYVENCDNTSIENNVVRDSYSGSSLNAYGIFVTISTNVTVKDNQVSTLTSASSITGIGINGSKEVIAQNNIVSDLNDDKGTYGLLDTYGYNDTLEGNFISTLNSSTSSYGVYSLIGKLIKIRNNTVGSVNTQANGCCYLSMGIMNYGNQNSTISENKINSITASGSAYNYGIEVRYSNYSFIENNSLQNITSYANPGETLGIFSDTSNNTIIHHNSLDQLVSTNDHVLGIITQLGENATIINNSISNVISKLKYAEGIYFIQNSNVIVQSNVLENFSASYWIYGIDGSASANFKASDNQMNNLLTVGDYVPYNLNDLNNSFISLPQIYKINFSPTAMNTLDYQLSVNGSLVQTGTTDFQGEMTLNFTNIIGTYNNITLTFIETGQNETYNFILIKPLTPALTLSKPTIVNPINNTDIINQEYLILEWLPSIDSLNNGIRYSIYYSNDSMNTWNTVTQAIVNNSYSFSLTKYNLTYNTSIYIKLVSYDNDVNQIQNSSIFYYKIMFVSVPPKPTTNPTTTPTTSPTTTTTSNSSTGLNTTTGTGSKSTPVSSLSILAGLSFIGILVIGKRRKRS